MKKHTLLMLTGLTLAGPIQAAEPFITYRIGISDRCGRGNISVAAQQGGCGFQLCPHGGLQL
ncbi:hypothetical protein [Marinicella meishanensis]|uniref:hypothetical protein n=1 Tax=Marinicella meishanensis TaxID=2873263 RepID=UPI001CBF7C9B|nr:hypothetical protein [Marinicella sp. NBU2979]